MVTWSTAGDAVDQVWPAFALVAGLLLVGAVAAEDGVFVAAGRRLRALATRPVPAYGSAVVLVALVTAVLNLDTAATFLPPVFAAATRRPGTGDPSPLARPLLYACLLGCNAASLVLPGSNLTNLIVLGSQHASGSDVARHTVAAWAAVVVVTAVVVAVVHRRDLTAPPAAPADAQPSPPARRARMGVVGATAVVAVVVVTLLARSPALPVLGIGAGAVLLASLRSGWGRARDALTFLGAPVLAALFAVATGAGVVGRAWSGPARLLAHGGAVGSAVTGAVGSVVLNNLPAAALLSARPPGHPFALLLGLDLGPNLAVTGSLSALLWWRASVRAGWRPSLSHVSLLGLLSVPPAMAAALALLRT